MAIKIINGKAVYVSENTKEPSSNVTKTPSYNTQPSTGSSIKIVNGKAVVVPNGQEPTNAPQTTQEPSKTNGLMSLDEIRKDRGTTTNIPVNNRPQVNTNTTQGNFSDLIGSLSDNTNPIVNYFPRAIMKAGTALNKYMDPRQTPTLISKQGLSAFADAVRSTASPILDIAMLPKVGLKFLLTSMGLGGLIGAGGQAVSNIKQGKDITENVLEALSQGVQSSATSAPKIRYMTAFTNPLIGNFGGNVASRVPGAGNVGQNLINRGIQGAASIPEGMAISKGLGRDYNPAFDAPLDFLMGALFPNQAGKRYGVKPPEASVIPQPPPKPQAQLPQRVLIPETPKNYTPLSKSAMGMQDVLPQFATERPTAQVGKTAVSNIPSGKLQPGESPESFIARIQAQNKKFSNMESPITKGGEWKAGQKEAFDHALSVKDATTVKNMLPDIPKEYKDRFSGQIKDTMKVDSILEQLVKPDLLKEKGALQKAKDTLASLNPYRFETGKLESRGPVGKEIVTRGRRANAQAIVTAGEFKKINESSGIAKLTEQQLLNFRDVMQNKAQPIDPTVMKIVQVYKPLFEKYGQATGVQMMENYYPRRLSPEFKKLLDVPQNREQIIQKIMTEGGVDRAKAVEMLDNGKRKGSFEFERTIKDLPDYLEVNGKKIPTRVDPLKEMYAWQNEVARRLGIIKEFGAKDEIAKSLISELGKGNKFESKWKQEAQDYVDRVAGRKYEVSELDPVYDFLKGTMVISKLNPLTTVSNELQGHINSWLQYGAKGLTDATFGKQGNEFIKTLGLDTLKGKIGDEVASNSWATKYMKAIGMEGSEVRGFGRTAQSTFGAINRAFSALKKNPSDAIAYKLLKDHGMFVDDTVLAKALADGKIPDMELKMGLVEGVRQKMFFATPGERPAWANTGAGGTFYMFKNYVMNQMQLLAKAPPERQLAYIMVVAPLMGLPVMTLRRMIQGRDMPENPADTFVQAASSGPGTPFDIYQSVSNKDFLTNFLLGGFSPLADIATSSNKLKSLIGAFGPASTLYKNRLFPPKK